MDPSVGPRLSTLTRNGVAYAEKQPLSDPSRRSAGRGVPQTHRSESEPGGDGHGRGTPKNKREIALQKRSVTADIALRLAKYFGNSPQFWLGLQMDYDLDVAGERLGGMLDRIVKAKAS